jgi:hypothetical protein
MLVRSWVIKVARAFFNAKDAATPSEFTGVIEQAAAILSHKIVTTAKATFMNSQSIESRQEAGIEGDIMTDLLTQQSPIAGAILESFPSLAKRLKKNPALMGMAQAAIAKFSQKGAPGNGATPPSSGDFATRLNLYR